MPKMANMENLCIFYCNKYIYMVENVSPPLNIPYHNLVITHFLLCPCKVYSPFYLRINTVIL